MGNHLLKEQSNTRGLISLTNLPDGSSELQIHESLFIRTKEFSIQNLINLQKEVGNTSISISSESSHQLDNGDISIHFTYNTSLSHSINSTTANVTNLKDISSTFDELSTSSSRLIRLLPLFPSRDIYIAFDNICEAMFNHCLACLFPRTSIEGSVSNRNLIDFISEELETLPFFKESLKSTRKNPPLPTFLEITPETLLLQEQLPKEPHKTHHRISRVIFNEIRRYSELITQCSLTKQLLKTQTPNNTNQEYLPESIDTVIFSNCDCTTQSDPTTSFSTLVGQFRNTREFIARNMNSTTIKQKLRNSELASLTQLTNLETLDLSGNAISDISPDTFSQSISVPNNHDDIDNKDTKMEIEPTSTASTQFIFDKLKTLCLNSNRLSSTTAFSSILQCPSFKHIERLYLISNNINTIKLDFDTTDSPTSNKYFLNNLSYLNLSCNKLSSASANAIFTYLPFQHTLKHLILRSNAIAAVLLSDDSPSVLSNLNYIDLSENGIDNEGFAGIIKEESMILTKNLQTLLISKNKISEIIPKDPTKAATLTAPLRNSNLKSLDLSRNKIQNDIINLLQAMPSQLESLFLDENSIQTPADSQAPASDATATAVLSHLKVLTLSNNSIKDISNLPDLIPNVTILDLSHNLIRESPVTTESSSWLHLHSCNLSYNLISNAATILNALLTSKSLRSINLSNNHIRTLTSLNKIPLQLTSHLISLNLSFNKIESNALSQFLRLHSQEAYLQHLERLNLSYNQIQDLSQESNNNSIDSPIKLPSLKTLLLAGNRINSQGFNSLLKCDFPALENLDLFKNSIQNISPEIILPLSFSQSLRKIDLSMNKLTCADYFQSLFQFNSVETLDLSDNMCEFTDTTLSTIPERIQAALSSNIQVNVQRFSLRNSLLDSNVAMQLLNILTSATHIDLSKNQITRVSGNTVNETKLNLPLLNVLDLSDNALTSESAAVLFSSNLPSLVKLNISKNKIESLPSIQASSPLLEELDCSYNQIETVSFQSFIKLNPFNQLRKLHLRSNKIHTPFERKEGVRLPLVLQSLTLSNNQITSESAFAIFAAQSDSLTDLDLSFNTMKSGSFPKTLEECGLTALRRLDVTGNQLGDQGSEQLVTSAGFPRLEDLNVSLNRIRELPKQFTLPRLWVFNISGNATSGVYTQIENYKLNNSFAKIIM